MNHSEKKPSCNEAELYYLSLAFGDEYGDMPEQVASHVESCEYCRTQLKVLKDCLLASRTEDSGNRLLSEAQRHLLGLHFAYIGKEIGCEIVKPFLPSLLGLSLKVRVPTPITVHLDRCELCRRDLAAITRMNLTAKQLTTLNSVLTDNTSVRSIDCSVAADSIQQYVNFDFQQIKPEVVKHLCCCSVCQLLLYKVRAENIKGLRETGVQTGFPCESVTFSDVFDYCFPYGLVSSSDQYAGFREPFVNELKSCAKCLQKVQDMHRQVYAIRQRAESGVKTIYETREVPKSEETASELAGDYSGFPINVKAISSGEERTLRISRRGDVSKADRTPRAFKTTFRHIAKVTVAAVVVFAVILFMRSTPKAAAVTIRQVYDAVQKAVNVHIQQFAAGDTEPLQEKWISRDRGIFAIRDENGFVVWDAVSGTKHSGLADSARRETIPLTELQSATIRKRIEGSLGLMPFEDASQVPQDAKWKELSVAEANGLPANMQVYELTWTKAAGNESVVRFKWRGYIDGD